MHILINQQGRSQPSGISLPSGDVRLVAGDSTPHLLQNLQQDEVGKWISIIPVYPSHIGPRVLVLEIFTNTIPEGLVSIFQ